MTMLVALGTQRGGWHAQETGLNQFVSCTTILQLHENSVSIPGWRKTKWRAPSLKRS